jgi:uncharacterized RDD family membrane protein YckC
MGSALLDNDALAPACDERAGDSSAVLDPSQAESRSTESVESLRLQVAERLAAHRSRRNPPTPPAPNLAPAPKRSSRIADAVAQRYANSPSYRAVLAAEAERATQQARAAAEVAALNAVAIAQAQQQLLDSLQEQSHLSPLVAPPEHPAQTAASNPLLWTDPAEPSRSFEPPHSAHRPAHKPSHRIAPVRQTQDQLHSALTVRLYEDEASAAHVDLNAPLRPIIPSRAAAPPESNAAEESALDEEIAFRQSPVFEESVGPAMPLPANLIEFPRQLVAPRKARPRYAEGPLRVDQVPAPGDGQLRIFEVDPAQISTTPAPDAAPQPQWTSLWLDAPQSSASSTFAPELPPSSVAELDPAVQASPDVVYHPDASAGPHPLIDVASIPRRLMAVALDGAILLAALAAFASTFVAVACRTPRALAAASPSLPHRVTQIASQFSIQTGLQLRPALLACTVTLLLLHLLYQTLFFTFSESTPGMSAVRIALCTFDDENPTRPALRRRVLAVLISACPLALGLLWALFDEDRLAWHDRITRSYQRIY